MTICYRTPVYINSVSLFLSLSHSHLYCHYMHPMKQQQQRSTARCTVIFSNIFSLLLSINSCIDLAQVLDSAYHHHHHLFHPHRHQHIESDVQLDC